MASNRRLQRQIEGILDTQPGQDEHEVIVRMARPHEGRAREQLLRDVADTISRRVLSTSARDCLPPDASKLGREPGKARPASSVRTLRAADRSLAAQGTAAALQDVAVDVLRSTGLGALQPLVESDIVKAAVAIALERVAGARRSRRPLPPPVRQLWTSSSAVLKLSETALRELPASVAQVEDIYANRRLSVPPVVRPLNLPARTDDNRTSAWGVRMVGALSTWGAYDARGEGAIVGLLDTGVDPTHPDLKDKIAAWAEFDADGNEVPGAKPRDSDRHGTHCAGTIVGGRASGCWIGVAPAAKIAAALVLDGARGGTDAQVLAGMEWAIERGVDVISMSLGGLTLGTDTPSTYTETILNALRLGIPVVAAIGNEGGETTGSPGNDFLAFAVGATDDRDRAAGFSGGRTQVIRQSAFFSPDLLPLVYSKPEVSAPGVAVLSAVPGGKWEHLNGTSMATPHVAGAIALLLSATDIRAKTPADQSRAFLIQDLVTGSVEELGEAGQDHRYGFGRIDILRAIGMAKERGF